MADESATRIASELPPNSPWVEGLTIFRALERAAGRFPGNDCLVFPALDYRLTYEQFLAETERAARGLWALGVRPGEHVAIWATNVPQWVILQFATARIGAVLTTINPAYRPFELKYVLAQCDAVALFLVERFKNSDYFAMLAEVCPELAAAAAGGELHAAEFPRLRSVVALGEHAPAGGLCWSEFLRRGEAVPAGVTAQAERSLSPRQPINIQYTSGTTGFPKAATLSHRNLLFNAFHVGECQRLTPLDRICIPVPFYHCFGCVLGTLCAVVHGATMVIPAESFHPRSTLRAIGEEQATSLYGVPTMFIALLQEPDLAEHDLRSLRTGIMAGSPCPIEVMKQIIERMGAREVTIAYGQTEASPVITQTRADDPLELRVETVGRPLPGVEVKIIDPESGAELGDNQSGELCCRGHVVMIGYYKQPEATAAAVDAAGWLHTGDIGLRLENGYYKITGRIKDMVIRGGENIYPREIEEFLFRHPAVEQAAVFGAPDPKFGEELCVWIKLKPGAATTEEEIRRYCREQLAHYKVPRYVKFVETFPQTVTGKIQKFKMREMTMAELGLSEPETA